MGLKGFCLFCWCNIRARPVGSRRAPRRFNPENRAWLPVMHTEIGDWHFTAIYSNIARPHQFKRTHDWVVVYYYDDHHREGPCTVVTEGRGPLIGRRVVRGGSRIAGSTIGWRRGPSLARRLATYLQELLQARCGINPIANKCAPTRIF